MGHGFDCGEGCRLLVVHAWKGLPEPIGACEYVKGWKGCCCLRWRVVVLSPDSGWNRVMLMWTVDDVDRCRLRECSVGGAVSLLVF